MIVIPIGHCMFDRVRGSGDWISLSRWHLTEIELCLFGTSESTFLAYLLTTLLPGLLLKLIVFSFCFLCLNLKLASLPCAAFDFSLPSLEKFDPGICTLKYIWEIGDFCAYCSGEFILDRLCRLASNKILVG